LTRRTVSVVCKRAGGQEMENQCEINTKQEQGDPIHCIAHIILSSKWYSRHVIRAGAGKEDRRNDSQVMFLQQHPFCI
jgi:hypothetical protein